MKVDHSTVQRWVVEYAPQLEAEFRKKYKRSVSGGWRMDETYLKIKGKDVYFYRAVDKYGKTIDFMFSEKAIHQHVGLWINKIPCQLRQ